MLQQKNYSWWLYIVSRHHYCMLTNWDGHDLDNAKNEDIEKETEYLQISNVNTKIFQNQDNF